MLFLTVNWGETWMLAGVSVGVVFAILLTLVLVLQIFSIIASTTNKVAPKAAAKIAEPVKAQPVANASEDEKAAIAAALYLYFNNAHDEESGILTIHREDHPAWHAELNETL